MPDFDSFDRSVPVVLMRLDRNPFHHGTLGAARSLGRAGVPVHAVVESPASPVVSSRYVRRCHVRPDGDDLTSLRAVLLAVSAELGGAPAVLLPMDDVGALALDALRPGLTGRYLLPGQPPGLTARVADKERLAALCRELDVPHPRTLVPSGAEEAAAMARELGLPVVAKWSRPWLLPAGSGLRSTLVARTEREVRALYGQRERAGSRLLLQERLPGGPGSDWFFHGYCDSAGGCGVAATGRKERSWPHGAGLTAVGTWQANPAVERSARRLVGELGYRGVVDLDFRRDPATGTYHLLDFNPRPGAQFRLFSDPRGLDVVRALHLDLTGRPVPRLTGVPGRRLVVEQYAALSLLTAPRPRRTAPGGAGVPVLPAGQGGTETAWYAADDPAPALAMARAWGAHALRTARARLAPRPRPSTP
ncbi:ATP-grasp domain-containing protein [Streptomyces sp. LP05-1]|uniref:ATP-grasp domain-containing protein n=1 Tax=Streptomyces pyxinae TaxID=2970734 RepID=A0ABT2CPI1_9ACTN|nr:ATP-grasp domain-containing protein [Streptomyces sp. LP05-1]MCS0638987.1 ATP-grasp domain-containing protein [Streptomyces sp. LP05-1]